MFTESQSRQAFDTSYQTIFQKVLVAMKVANTRLESLLTYGQTVKRVRFDINSVPVRALNDNADYTIDTVTDSSELLTIDKNFGLVFHVSNLANIQSGPLRPEEVIGMEMAKKVARYVDGDVLNGVKSASYTFDNGDLTTAISSGTPITLTTTVVPNFVAQTKAKLRANNIDVDSGACYVIDPYLHSIVEQYLMGKNNDMSVGEFANGYAGMYNRAEVYVSTNLPSDIALTMGTNPSDNQTLTIGSTTLTFKTALTPAAGEVLIGATNDLTGANLVQAINAASARVNTPSATPAGSGTNYVEFTGSALNTFADLRLTASYDNTSNVLSVASIGGGRLAYGTTITGATFANVLHVLFGKKKCIDLVVQDKVEAESIPNQNRFGMIVRGRTVYGTEVFTDGAQQMLDVKMAF